jgi:mono/diheme cytochrome c family protein
MKKNTQIKTLALFAGAASMLTVMTTEIAAAPAPLAGDAADNAFVSRSKFGETTGEAMYRRVCAACHMADGKGAQGAGYYPALAKNPKLETGAYPLAVLMNGLNGMPALGTMMSDQQAADVVNYIRTNLGNRYKDPVTAAEAKQLR